MQIIVWAIRSAKIIKKILKVKMSADHTAVHYFWPSVRFEDSEVDSHYLNRIHLNISNKKDSCLYAMK